MGLMRFVADDESLLTDERLSRAYIAGLDDSPTVGRTLRTGAGIVVERAESGSGSFAIPWPAPTQGDWLLQTSTLMERERPYQLETELARGTVYRLRDQLAQWQTLGLQASDGVLAAVADATRLFSRAAVTQGVDGASAAAWGRMAIEVAAEGSCRLADLYAEQALALRAPDGQRLSTLLGVRLGPKAPRGVRARRLAEAFNLAVVPCPWGAVEPVEGRRDWTSIDKPLEWARASGLRVCLGPLLDFDDRRIPDWGYLWEGDFSTLSSLMLSHVRATVQRYRGRVQLWHLAAKVNRDRVLSLSDEQRLKLVANAVGVVRQLDPSAPVVVGVEQPWGEYRGARQSDLAPIDFADALERADLGIAGFDLEMNVGYRPHGTELRNPLAFSRLVDFWNVRLESPLMVTITFPSGADEDPGADPRQSVVASMTSPGLLTPELQADWARRRAPMLLAKNAVQVLVWGQEADHGPHALPHGGLFDNLKLEKPALGVLADLRKRLLS